jgi:hypothetical protein
MQPPANSSVNMAFNVCDQGLMAESGTVCHKQRRGIFYGNFMRLAPPLARGGIQSQLWFSRSH